MNKEIEIPEGYEARIEGNKVIIVQKESEDERIKRDIIKALRYGLACEESVLMPGATTTLKEAIAYLEKQKDNKFAPRVLPCSAAWFEDGEEKQKEQPMELLEPDKNVEKIIEDVIRVYGKTQGEWVGGYDIDTLIVNLRRAFGQKEQSFTHHEIDESLRDAVMHQMEDDGDVDDFVRRGMDNIVLKYAELGARWQKDKMVKFGYDREQKYKIACWKSLGECSDIPDGHYVVGWFRFGDFRLGIMCNGLFVDINGNRAEQPKEVFYIPNTDEKFIYAEQKFTE